MSSPGKDTAVKPYKPLFSFDIGDKELAEVKALNPQILDSALQKMKTAVENKVVNAMGLPYDLFGNDTSYPNVSTEYASSLPSTAEMIATALWWSKEFAGVCYDLSRLPNWITTNRYELAKKLWLASEVFQHNMAVLGKYHGLC